MHQSALPVHTPNCRREVILDYRPLHLYALAAPFACLDALTLELFLHHFKLLQGGHPRLRPRAAWPAADAELSSRQPLLQS